MSAGQFIAAKKTVDPIIDWAVSMNYRKRLAQIYTIIGTYDFACDENYNISEERLEKALKISSDLHDANSKNWAHYWLGILSAHNCRFQESERHFTQTLHINEERGNTWGVSLMTAMLSGWVHCSKGNAEMAYKVSKEATRISEESGDAYSKAMSYNSHGLSCFGRGLLEDGIHHGKDVIHIIEKLDMFWPHTAAHENLAGSYFELVEYEKAEQHYDRACHLLESGRFQPSWKNLNEVGAAKAAVRASGRVVDLERLRGYEAANKVKLHSGAFKRYLAELLLSYSDNRVDEAEHWITRAIETDGTNGMMLGVAHDYAL